MAVATPAERLGDRRLVLGLALAIAGALVSFYWLGVRPIPADYGCGEDPTPMRELRAFRAGAPLIHVAAALAVLAGAVALSWRRNGRPGLPTLAFASLLAAVAVAAAAGPDRLGVLVTVWALYTALFTVGILPLAGLGLLVAGAFVRTSTGDVLTAAGLWLVAVFTLPAHVLLVYLQGEGPLFC